LAFWRLASVPFPPFSNYIAVMSVSMKIKMAVVRLEVFTAVTMQNGGFWDVTPCGSFKN
jgi:hypothetical protein